MRFIVCFCCGREFGSASISIHVPKCLEKFDVEQSKFPPSKRKPRPAPPPDWDKMISGDSSAIKEFKQQYNEAAEKAFDEQRTPCPHCGRKFYPLDRLQIHLKSCGPTSYFAKQTASKKADSLVDSIFPPPLPTSSSPPKETPAKTYVAVKDNSNIKKIISDEKTVKESKSKLANFCPECGVKFSSNFCANCGTKRSLLC